MSSSSSPMDYQKHVKVKSRWTQSCQMEMLMEESQSSLDMSDTITDVSTSDLNESTDFNFEHNCTELRRSRRTSNNRTDYRQLNGLKKTVQKKSITSETSNKRGRKKKQPLHTTKTDKDQFKDNTSQELNIIKLPSIDWNNIKFCQSREQSKSVNNLSEIVAMVPSKPIRRASLFWEFKFTPQNEVKDNNSILSIKNCYNLSNSMDYLNLKETLLETVSSSTDNSLLFEDNNDKNKTTNEDTSQQLYYSDALNSKNVNGYNNEMLNFGLNNISVTNFNKQKHSDEFSTHINQSGQTFEVNCSTVSNLFSSELKNLRFSPIHKNRKIRSKSFDSLIIKSNDTMRRFKSYDDIDKLENFEVDTFISTLHKLIKESIPNKRRQSKRIKPKNNYVEILDDMKVPEVNYDHVADEIYREHKNQLLEARMNDKEFNQKLESTNFTLVNENVYRPTR